MTKPRKFYHYCACNGCWAKLTVEWFSKQPLGEREWKVEEEADEVFMAGAPYVRNILNAMLGRKSK